MSEASHSRPFSVRAVRQVFAAAGVRLTPIQLPSGPGSFKIGKGYKPMALLEPPGTHFSYTVNVYRTVAQARTSRLARPVKDPLFGFREATLWKGNVLVLYRLSYMHLRVVRAALSKLR
jgi:hypothetical protein